MHKIQVMKIADIRRDYKLQSLSEDEVSSNPFDQFSKWWDAAVEAQIDEVNAMTLATADKNGKPRARIVLLKGYDERGFVFFTNYNSQKGKELLENPQVSIVFFWKELERQVRIDGTVKKVSAVESDEYFNSRPRQSKIGAWTSPQSQPIGNRKWLEDQWEEKANHFEGKEIHRPEHWGGYLIEPAVFEFWQGRPGRLHDRIQYSKESGLWKIERLAP